MSKITKTAQKRSPGFEGQSPQPRPARAAPSRILPIEKMFPNSEFVEYRNTNNYIKHPSSVIISGQSGSGKTTVLLNLLTNVGIKMDWDRLYIFSPNIENENDYTPFIDHIRSIEDTLTTQRTAKAYADHLKEHGKTLKDTANATLPPFIAPPPVCVLTTSNDLNDLPPLQELDRTKQNIVIIDDFMLKSHETRVKEYFMGARKYNCSTFFLTQKFTAVDRIIRLNAHVLIACGQQTVKERNIIFGDMGLNIDKDVFARIIKNATENKYGFLVCYLGRDINETYRNGFDNYYEGAALQNPGAG